MALIQWTDRLSVGVPQFDAEHQQLVRLINRLHEAMSQGKGRDVSAQILGELVRYVKTHFETEERALSACCYPDLAAHKAEHARLTAQVQEFQARLFAGEAAITISLLNFLRDWLTSHIQQSDMQYSGYLAPRGVPA